jgi:glutathione synthase/RimK-type ligase-like ATP-grasp enzyme
MENKTAKKLAIHGDGLFYPRWVDYCKQQKIPYKIVNCYDTDIIEQVADCDALMWHYHQTSYKDKLFAKELLFALEQSGKKVFPNFNTAWHFDDKVGQKYLFEAIGVPFVPAFVFYSKQEALNWSESALFPKVFKLRGGAGSSNVLLVKNKREANRLINKAFGNGFPQYNAIMGLKERWRKYRAGKSSLIEPIKGLVRFIYPMEFVKMYHPEKGYVYFQDFIPNNDSDIRIIVIEDKAFAIKRLVRENDFRASGSGFVLYEKELFNEHCVNMAFNLNEKIKSQSLAIDFVFDSHNNPLIIEISYGFIPAVYDPCTGYWTKDLQWHEGKINPYGWMVDNLIK